MYRIILLSFRVFLIRALLSTAKMREFSESLTKLAISNEHDNADCNGTTKVELLD